MRVYIRDTIIDVFSTVRQSVRVYIRDTIIDVFCKVHDLRIYFDLRYLASWLECTWDTEQLANVIKTQVVIGSTDEAPVYTHTLTFVDMTFGDEGEYTCKVTRVEGGESVTHASYLSKLCKYSLYTSC